MKEERKKPVVIPKPLPLINPNLIFDEEPLEKLYRQRKQHHYVEPDRCLHLHSVQ